jgi:bis(5'-nucleosyl)-tetraphosphatase (symmetrical)
MAVYVIGDVQGCYEELRRLVELIHFEPGRDQLWFAGDLVNRGPDSLSVLRFVKDLGDDAITVLGNHDLHLLAVAYGERQPNRNDSLDAILDAPDRDALIDWLRSQPLFYERDGFVMTHAGIPHIWSVDQTAALAREVEQVISGPGISAFLAVMYGNEPDLWQDDLRGGARLRTITNYLTRMRALDSRGRLNLKFKESLSEMPEPWRHWFDYYADGETARELLGQTKEQSARDWQSATHSANAKSLLFGHWAALNGRTGLPFIHALDTGCVWGGSLTAMRLEDHHRFQVPAVAKHRRAQL